MKITMYELLGLVKDGKAPKKIKFNEDIYTYHDKEHGYCKHHYDNTYICINSEYYLFDILNDEVEILEEKPTQEEIKEYTNKFLEVWKPINKQFCKLFDELLRIKNDLGLNLEDEIKEEKKIPEKLNYQYRNLYGRLSQHKQSEIDIIDTLNGVIDYLKSKGE